MPQQLYLGRGLHFLNWLVDTAITLLLFVLLVRLLLPSGIIKPDQNRALKYLFLVFNFFYYLLFETLLKKTPAKYLTRSVVVSSDGLSIGFKTILVRSLSRFIPFEPLGIFFTEDKSTLHDILSNTKTIKLNKQLQ